MMTGNRKDALGAVAVAIVAIVLFVLSMGSMAMLGQRTGQKVKSSVSETTRTVGESDAAGPENGVPVLCYHYLRHSTGFLRFFKVLFYVVLSMPVLDDNEIWTQSEGAFEKQMKYLHENGYQTITLDDLTAWQYGRRPLPPKPVVITFDDGDRSVYDYAWPILDKYGFNATYFIITNHVGRKWEGLSFLNWSQLREMSESGVFAIESHTHDLHYKIGDKNSAEPVFLAASESGHTFPDYDRWEDRVLDDLEASRDAIARNVGRAPHHLAWPYGYGNDEVDRLAAIAGFERISLLREGVNHSFAPIGGDTLSAVERLSIQRYAISARTSMKSFKKMLSGEYHSEEPY